MSKPMTKELMMVDVAVKALKDKMAKDVVSLHVGEATPITDYFILASCSNKSQMDACIDGVEDSMKEAGFMLKAREGRSTGGWVLLDYSDVIIHIFDIEMRDFYGLDSSWRDVERKNHTD